MAFNYFIGWNQQDLEAELRSAQEDLAAGKATIAAQGGDSRIASQIDSSAQERIKLILKALNKLDPTTYPIADITAITKTRASFTSEAL